jgi:uncharacterized membrane protein SirB2
MTRKYWPDLGPSLLVGIGIVVATFVSVLAAKSGWLVLAGPLVLALTVVGADVLGSRLRGKSSRPSWTALLVAGSFLLAGVIVALRDPILVKTLVPVIGTTAWMPLLLRPGSPRKACRSI